MDGTDMNIDLSLVFAGAAEFIGASEFSIRQTRDLGKRAKEPCLGCDHIEKSARGGQVQMGKVFDICSSWI